MRGQILGSIILLIVILLGAPGMALEVTDYSNVVGVTINPPATTTEDFLGLLDTPISYAGDGADCVKVNGAEDGLEFGSCTVGAGGGNTTEEMQDAVGSGFGDGITYIDATNAFLHSDTSNQSSSDNSALTVIQDIILDGYGHLTSTVTVDVNATGFIKDWNWTSFIIDWNATGYIRDWGSELSAGNSTGLELNWSDVINATGYVQDWNATGFIRDWRTEINDTGILQDYNATGHITNENATAMIINWTEVTDHARNDTGKVLNWSDVINETGYVIDWNWTSFIIDWNATGYIRDWRSEINDTGILQNYNSTGLIQNWNATRLIQNYSQIIETGGGGGFATDQIDNNLNTTANVTHFNMTVEGNLNATNIVSLQGIHNLQFKSTNDDAILDFVDVGGNNYVGIETTGGFFQLYANPNAGNDYLLATISETQGADTEINFYEGGTTHNRFWDSGSARFGGPVGRLCTQLTDWVDCDTSATGADVVIEDELAVMGKIFTSDWTNVSVTTSQIKDFNITGFIQNWNATGLIRNYEYLNDTGYIIDWNWTGLIQNYNATGLIRNYEYLNDTGYIIDWNASGHITNENATAMIINWTEVTDHARNDTGLFLNWSDVINETGYVIDWNWTNFIIDWNATGFIRDWRSEINDTGIVANYNATGFIQNWNWSGFIQNWGDSIWNDAEFNETLDGTYVNISGDTVTGNLVIEKSLNATEINITSTTKGINFDNNCRIIPVGSGMNLSCS